ncbi:MAG: glycerophosphodiester phosphodiesterase family protein [Candidatus Bathyarchaeota archaeon]|nr:glycerophosphodiester phosphodiesterase family protein [Candidatus Bathyarchaeota archaeon]
MDQHTSPLARAVLRIGHRGAAGYEPENTLRSFEAAVRLGADMVEFDIHLCGSGELVVIHDETVDRTTDGSGTVAGMTLRELKALDAGRGEKIPTLGEVFSQLRGRVTMNIELKGRGTAEPVHEYLTGYIRGGSWGLDEILVTSFDWRMLGAMRELSDDIRLGPLVYKDINEALRIATELDSHSVNPYHRSIDLNFVKEVHGLGIGVYPWTVDDPEDIRRVVGMGVDGVISDYPERVS